MAFLPSQHAHNLVQRMIDDIKKNAAEHAKRHARSRLRGADLPAVRTTRAVRAQPAPSKERRSTWSPYQHLGSLAQCAGAADYFTRLVNSSPKPRVLRSVQHPVAIHLLKLAHSASYRKYRRLVLLTSAKLIREYCARHGACSRIYTTSHDNPLLMETTIRADRIIACSSKLLQKIADLHSYKGGLVAEVPYPQPVKHLGNAKLVLCVAPGRRDADNDAAATLMRTAQALCWQAIWLLKHGERDFMHPRAIRASQNCLGTMPYLAGDAQQTIAFARENDMLMCICADGGATLDSEDVKRAISRHRGVMLLAGQQPKELVDAATKIDLDIPDKRTRNATSAERGAEQQHYKLDGITKSCILMYLVRKSLHSAPHRSPYIA